MLARIYFNKKDSQSAIKTLQDLLTKAPDSRAGLLLLAQIQEREKDLKGAETSLKKLVALEPEKESLKALLAGFYDRTDQDEAAEKIYQDLIAADPEKEEIRLALAQFFFKKKKPEKMVQVLEQAIKDLPTQFGAYNMLARYWVTQKKAEKALELAEAYLSKVETGPSRISAMVLKAQVLFELKKVDEAAKIVDEILQQNPGDVAAHSLRGDILLLQKDYLGAVTEYRSVGGRRAGKHYGRGSTGTGPFVESRGQTCGGCITSSLGEETVRPPGQISAGGYHAVAG